MSAADAQAEPTMEEILASIRRIISEDEAGAPPAEAAAPADDFADEVLELSMPEPAGETHVSPDFDFDALPMDDPAPEPAAAVDDLMVMDREEEPAWDPPAPIVEPPAPSPVRAALDDFPPAPSAPPVSAWSEQSPHLVGEAVASVAANTFARLNTAAPMPGQFTSGNTVEALVAELLRPMLKSWLDANLPRIVEEKVEAEVARVRRMGL
jgi:uncharacterized protein